MVSRHHVRFGGDMMSFVVERKDSLYSHFNLPLLFISKAHDMKAHGKSY